jgi:hypothetical protein
MANKPDIFSRLKEYEVQPPPEVFHHLFNRLQAEMTLADDSQWQGALQELQQLEIQPPSFMPLAITNTIDKPLFSFLQEIAIAPPAGAFDHIIRQVSATPVRKLFSRYRAIVAVLLLVVAGWSIYRFTNHSPGKVPATVAKKTVPEKLPVTDPVKQPAIPGNTDTARYQLYDNVRVENYFKSNRFVAEGSGMLLVDNDFMVTFTSFPYEELPPFLTEEENSELIIRIDKYSYFTVSKGMMDMLKKMYRLRPRGTPTRKARKEKAKLEQWKKADSARFDNKYLNNPLDPIDLAEFIFK